MENKDLQKKSEVKEIDEENQSKFGLQGFGGAEAVNFMENMQYSKYHTKGGHGFAAEDANAFYDIVRFKDVDLVGRNNELNGADRIVEGIKIQTKYYKTPQETISSAFDSKSGLYRYTGQILEVPADQYEACVKLMERKIIEGKVPGFKNPEDARKIVKKGLLTYNQARNIAKVGNIDSLMFDAATQAVISTHVLGLSFTIAFALAKWRGKSHQEAMKVAMKSAIETAGTTFITGIVTAQLLRTKSAAAATVTMRHGVKIVYKSPIGKSLIENLAKASLRKPVYGAAAVNHVSKLLRSNAIVLTVSTAVTIAPDFYRAAVRKNISWKQFTKNLIVNVSSAAGGIGGWMAGAAAGAAVGSAFPIIGTGVVGFIGGVIGALAGGGISGKVSKKVVDSFAKDDAEEMMEILEKVVEEISYDYLLTKEEIEKFLSKLKDKINLKFLCMFLNLHL